MSVAVLIVNFQVYDALDRALASLQPVLRPGDEVVVVDQSSQFHLLAPIAARYPSVRFLPEVGNRGFAAAINQAAAASAATELLWLNPDALVEGPVIEVLEAWLATHPETGCVGPRVINSDGSVQASARRFPDISTAIAGRSTWLTRHFPNNPLSRHNLLARDGDGTRVVDWLAGSCLMTRRDLFERLGGLDQEFFLYWEDADYCRRALALGFTSTYLPSVVVRHRGGLSAARNPAPAIRAFHASAYRMFVKHAGLAGRVVSPVVRAGLWVRGEWLARKAEARVRRTRTAM